VALTVDADDATLDAIAGALRIDIWQLHGGESPERVAEVRARRGAPVIKALGVREAADLSEVARYDGVADMLLLDAKPPRGATRPGGNGLAFDWRLIAERRWCSPVMLAGGLTPETVAEAARRTGVPAVDVSTGVERAPGEKDPARIRAFLDAARSA
ncbi:MAG: phosphoribosylanthranilate isomerase, partial [Pseudomonadota bacterium]